MGYLGEFEQLILFSVVQLGDDAYGVAIRETIEQRTGRVVSSGAIYTALGRLEGRGLVTSRVEKSPGPHGSSSEVLHPRTRGRPRVDGDLLNHPDDGRWPDSETR